MHTTIEQLHALMTTEESEHIEFKKATIQFDSDKLTRYCVAMANEGGGKIVFGVSDKKPRKVISTLEYPHVEKTKKQLLERLAYPLCVTKEIAQKISVKEIDIIKKEVEVIVQW